MDTGTLSGRRVVVVVVPADGMILSLGTAATNRFIFNSSKMIYEYEGTVE
jgi:hypothetical protein